MARLTHQGPPGPKGLQGIQGVEGPEGVEGPQGPEGSVKQYIHVQSTPAATWLIKHELERFPPLVVQDTANDEVEGDIKYLNENELQVKFSAPFAGVAYVD